MSAPHFIILYYYANGKNEMEKKIEQKFVKPRRMLGGKNTKTGQDRYYLYKVANDRITESIKKGFYIEAISICESMITDRIEARIQYLKNDDPEKHIVDSLGNRRKFWKEIESLKNDEFTKLNEEIIKWSHRRNKAVHQYVKITDQDDEDVAIEKRMSEAKNTLDEGLKIMRRMSKFVYKHNDWSLIQKK